MTVDVGTPADYGLPPKFARFRKAQQLGLGRILDESFNGCPAPRFRGVQMVVGSGKTGYFMALDRLRRAVNPAHRTAILTMTKPLQRQILDDFSSLGLFDMRGRSNYACTYYGDCERGAEQKCSLSRGVSCLYRAAYEQACQAPVVITNLAYWLAIHRHGEGLGRFDLLVIDEAHSLLAGLTDAATLRFSPHKGPQGEFGRIRLDLWRLWGRQRLDEIKAELRLASSEREAKLRKEQLDLEFLVREAKDGEYVVDVNEEGWAQVAPIWPADSAERLLYQGVPEVVLLSGVLLPKTMQLVGAKGAPGTARFESYPAEFSPSSWPVQLVDVGRIQHNMSSSTKGAWINAHAKIIAHHRNHKGIVHTVSYTRAQEIFDALPAALRPRCILHRSGNIEEAITKFKLANWPAVLLSPALTTGYDFPEEEENFSIVSKMPRPDFSSTPNLRRERKNRDPSYDDYEMMMTFQQMIGRMKRTAAQRAAVYVLDSHARYLLPNHRSELVSEWVYPLLVWGKKGDPSPQPAF